jgi:hypothetical protein
MLQFRVQNQWASLDIISEASDKSLTHQPQKLIEAQQQGDPHLFNVTNCGRAKPRFQNQTHMLFNELWTAVNTCLGKETSLKNQTTPMGMTST